MFNVVNVVNFNRTAALAELEREHTLFQLQNFCMICKFNDQGLKSIAPRLTNKTVDHKYNFR